jgi:hypothetical protein
LSRRTTKENKHEAGRTKKFPETQISKAAPCHEEVRSGEENKGCARDGENGTVNLRFSLLKLVPVAEDSRRRLDIFLREYLRKPNIPLDGKSTKIASMGEQVTS